MASTEIVQRRLKVALNGLAVLDISCIAIFLLLIVIYRIYTASTGEIPAWIENLNSNHFKHYMTNTSASGFFFVLLFAVVFVIPKLIGDVFLWKFVWRRNKTELPRWIVVTTMLCIIGFLFLIPMSRHDVYEYGMSFVFAVTTTLISFPTILAASAYFYTYAFDEVELIWPADP